VQAALAKGYKLGFTACSDTDSADVGAAGKTGIWARSLTREDVWEALWERRCYATTGERIFLKVLLNGYPMESEIKTDRVKKRNLKITVVGTKPIKTAEIIRNNRLIHIHKGKGEIEEIEYQDRESIEFENLVWYYVRIVQVDGEMAWSSPIWIETI